MVPGLLSTVMPCRSASPERGRTCASKPGGSSSTSPVGTSVRAPAPAAAASLPHGGHEVHAGGTVGLVSRQGEALGVRQALDLDAQGWLGAASRVMSRP